MSSAERFAALIVTILTGFSIVFTGMGMVVRALWRIRGSWDETNGKLGTLVDRVTTLAERSDRTEDRLERHLEWHERQPS